MIREITILLLLAVVIVASILLSIVATVVSVFVVGLMQIEKAAHSCIFYMNSKLKKYAKN